MYEKLRDHKLARDLATAKKLLEGHEAKDLEQRREILRAGGVEERVVLKACPPEGKKGLLDFLKSG